MNPNEFLQQLINSQEICSIYLLNNKKLSGIIIGYDDNFLILERHDNQSQQMVAINAIVTIVPPQQPRRR